MSRLFLTRHVESKQKLFSEVQSSIWNKKLLDFSAFISFYKRLINQYCSIKDLCNWHWWSPFIELLCNYAISFFFCHTPVSTKIKNAGQYPPKVVKVMTIRELETGLTAACGEWSKSSLVWSLRRPIIAQFARQVNDDCDRKVPEHITDYSL